MPISEAIRLFVRQRARFVCEYCGVSEIGGGGELTIDHFHPLSKGGGDQPDNLIYCCVRCNLHKGDYWPDPPDSLPLWNPRLEFSSLHFKTLNRDSKLPVKAEYRDEGTGETVEHDEQVKGYELDNGASSSRAGAAARPSGDARGRPDRASATASQA